MNLFYRAKWLKHQKRKNMSPLYTSLLSILLCIICLAGTSWAWFTSNQVVAVEPIASAQWELQSLIVYEVITDEVTAAQTDTNEQAVQTQVSVTKEDNKWTFSASADTQYAVSVFMNGTASTGFLLVETCDGNFCTTARESNFGLLLSENCKVLISASWGFDENKFIDDGVMPIKQEDVLGKGALPTCSCEILCTEEVVSKECISNVPSATPLPPAEPTATPLPPAEPTATPLPPAEPTATPLPPAEPTATPLPPAEPDITTD